MNKFCNGIFKQIISICNLLARQSRHIWRETFLKNHLNFSNLARGPAFSYDLNHTFQPWDDLSESCSYKDNLKFMSQLDQAELMDDVGKHAHEVMRNVRDI